MKQLLLATANPDKLAELKLLVSGLGVEVRSLREVRLPSPSEVGGEYVEHASLKARAAANASGLVTLADDSGIEIDALDGAPGVHTADWAGSPRDFARAHSRVLAEVRARGIAAPSENGPQLSAAWCCALAFAEPDGEVSSAFARVTGRLVTPRGPLHDGFHFAFLPDGFAATYAQLDVRRRVLIDARACAMRVLLPALTRALRT